ncbi:hypothetical protein Tco_0059518 [Tanacetum coccineum]
MDASGGSGSNSPVWPIVDDNGAVDMNGTMDNLEERIVNLEMVFAYLKNKKMLERQENKPKKGLAAAHTWACTGNKTFGTRKSKDAIVAGQARKEKKKGSNFLQYFGAREGSYDPMFIEIDIPAILHLQRRLFESRGCLILVSRDDIDFKEFTIYEMVKGCPVWTISIGLAEREEDSFLVINISKKVVKYNIISKTISQIFDIGSNEMDDEYELFPAYKVAHNPYEFIPSFASV